MSRTALVLASLLALHGAAAAAPAVGELWEMQLQMRSSSHGNVAMAPQRLCQRATALRENPREWMGPQATGGCTAADVQRRGDRISWRMQCRDGAGSGEIRFAGSDRMEGTMRMKNAQGDFELQVSGRRIGTSCALDGEGS